MSAPLLRRIEDRRTRAAEIERRLTELRAEVADLERELGIVDAERRAYADALEIMGAKPKRVTTASADRVPSGARSLSKEWKAILGEIARSYPRATTNDEIVSFAATSGIALRRETLRSQMMLYKRKGFVEPDAPGVPGAYRITASGAQAIGVELQNEAPAEAGAQIREEATVKREEDTKPSPAAAASDQPPWGSVDDEIPF